MYARDLSKPLIFTVDSGLLTDLKKTVDDFRLKDVFEFKPYTALGVDVTYASATHSFAKSKPAGGEAGAADVWKQTKPDAKDVNATAMTDLLNTVSSIRATGFVDRAPGRRRGPRGRRAVWRRRETG